MVNPYNTSPEQERRWAAEKYAALIKTLKESPALANKVLAFNYQHWIAGKDREPSRLDLAEKIFQELAQWIADHPQEGAVYLERWDRLPIDQRKTKRGHETTTDPLYSASLRQRARELWYQQRQRQQ